MTPEQRREIIRILEQGEQVSPEWARILFPPEKREYELVYHGKEREEYAWKKGEHPKRGEFSPDFFIKKDDTIHVVEIKADDEISEPSVENQKKHEYAIAHFERLNNWIERVGLSVRYQFNFLTPKDYNKFFQKMRNNDLKGFRSELDVSLKKAASQ